MSTAESAWMPSPRRPGYRVASYSSSTRAAIGNGSRPTTRSRTFRLQTWRSGCSMNARTSSAGASASPMPVRPCLVRQADDDGIGGPIAVARVDGRRDDGNDLEAGDRRAHGAPCGRGGSAERIGTQTAMPGRRVGMVGSVPCIGRSCSRGRHGGAAMTRRAFHGPRAHRTTCIDDVVVRVSAQT